MGGASYETVPEPDELRRVADTEILPIAETLRAAAREMADTQPHWAGAFEEEPGESDYMYLAVYVRWGNMCGAVVNLLEEAADRVERGAEGLTAIAANYEQSAAAGSALFDTIFDLNESTMEATVAPYELPGEPTSFEPRGADEREIQ